MNDRHYRTRLTRRPHLNLPESPISPQLHPLAYLCAPMCAIGRDRAPLRRSRESWLCRFVAALLLNIASLVLGAGRNIASLVLGACRNVASLVLGVGRNVASLVLGAGRNVASLVLGAGRNVALLVLGAGRNVVSLVAGFGQLVMRSDWCLRSVVVGSFSIGLPPYDRRGLAIFSTQSCQN
jgi:hypothetical protein